MSYLVDVPPRLERLVAVGKCVVDGVMVRNVETGLVEGHLQQAGGLVSQVASVGAVANPVLAGAGLVSSLGANVQNEVLRRKLNVVLEQMGRLQMLTSVGAAASVINVGVSAAGFALVLRRLRTVSDKVEKVSAKIDAAKGYPFKVNALAAVRRCEDAFKAAPGRQPAIWEEAESELDRAFEHFMLVATGASLDRPAEAAHATAERLFFDDRFTLDEANAVLDWLLMTARARLEALLLLGDPGSAEQLARSLAAWLGQIEAEPRAVVEHKLGGRHVSTALRERLTEEVVGATGRVRAAEIGSVVQADACASLREHSVDTERLVRAARDHKEPDLLYLPIDDLPEVD